MIISDLSYLELVPNLSSIIGGKTTIVAESSTVVTGNGQAVEMSSTISTTISPNSLPTQVNAVNNLAQMIEQVQTITQAVTLPQTLTK